jgi:hypothetical protein
MIHDDEVSQLIVYAEKVRSGYPGITGANESLREIAEVILQQVVEEKQNEPGITVLEEEEPVPVVPGVEKEQDISSKFFIENAGIILLYPYLKKLFTDKGLLNDEADFKNEKDRLFACYLLQFIATGQASVKEYELVLNKILCGYPQEAAVSRTWDKKDANPEDADAFLKSVIANWPKIGNTSPDGLRGSFLFRSGRLTDEGSNWLLHVERKAWDLLLDTLPYPLSIIKLPWMIKPIYVQW